MALMFGTTFAHAGVIVTGITAPDPCVETKVDSGIITAGVTGVIVTGFTGVIVTGFTGVIVTGAADEPTVNCGILISD